MEPKNKKSINFYMRALHRDLGFFALGLVIIYSLSGIVLIYRDSDFLKHNVVVQKKLSPNMESSELGKTLHMRDLKITKTEGETIYFESGTYNKTTGATVYTSKEIIFPINKFINLHKTSSRGPAHWFTTIFGLILFFMAISSLWMFKTKTRLFRRGMIIAGTGILVTVLILLL